MKKLLLQALTALLPLSFQAQTAFLKPFDHPILSRDTVQADLSPDFIAISDPWVVKESAGVYKMWYTCGGFNYPTDSEFRSRICSPHLQTE